MTEASRWCNDIPRRRLPSDSLEFIILVVKAELKNRLCFKYPAT